MLFPPTPLPLSSSSLPISPSPLYNMSQHDQINYEFLDQQQQKQLAVLQAQIPISSIRRRSNFWSGRSG